MRPNFRLVIVFTISIVSLPSHSEDLRKQYQAFVDSMTGASFEFTCGSSTYKLEKKLFKSAKIYFQEELDWYELSDLELKATGVRFSGTGVSGDIPLSLLNFKEDLPIFNSNYGRYKTKHDFYTDISKKKFVPMSSEVDFYKGRLTQKNSSPIIRLLSFNSEKYASSQTKRNKEYFPIISVGMMEEVEIKILKERIAELEEYGSLIPEFYKSELNKKKAQLNATQEKLNQIQLEEQLKREKDALANAKRIDEVNRVINNTSNSVMAMAGLGAYKLSKYCYYLE